MSKPVDVIFFNFQILDTKGNLIESSDGQHLPIIQGQNQIFQPVEKTLVNLNPGEKAKVSLKSSEAYGEYQENLLIEVQKSKFPAAPKPKIGDHFNMDLQDLPSMEVTIVDEKDGTYY